MKICNWCGCVYPDDAAVCAIDQRPLDGGAPPQSAPVQVEESQVETVEKPQHFPVLLLRYFGAIVVSCLVSFAVFYCGMRIFIWAGVPGFVVLLVAVGFCGVFSGTLCLPRSNRRFGSVFLLILGLAFYIYTLSRLNLLWSVDNSFAFVWLVPLGGGGTIASLVLWRKLTKPLKQQPGLTTG